MALLPLQANKYARMPLSEALSHAHALVLGRLPGNLFNGMGTAGARDPLEVTHAQNYTLMVWSAAMVFYFL